MNKYPTPELLAPAGTPEALKAAVAAGADAVYFGVGAFNARMNAKNFGSDDLKSALSLCHAHGVAAHITLNTQIYDKELTDAIRTAEMLYRAGVDALIVADPGLAALIHKYFPDLELHASTQASGHSLRDAEYFASLGYSRIVVARETSRENIRAIVDGSPIMVEMFVHGANCVSVSGQCLMSSLIGGRSGNRGECAQPCRLKYNGAYPLSPKDLCLAEHIREICELGVGSLKIEGRMKSPDYVYRVTSVYRRLLDEIRNASAGEMAELARAFSRSGFTDGFFTSRGKADPNKMLGIRTDADKNETRASETAVPPPKAVDILSLSASFIRGEKSKLTLSTKTKTVTVTGDMPELAKTRPMTAEYAASQLKKLGGTPFTAENARVNVTIDDGVMLPASALNELRRRAVAALTEKEIGSGAMPEGERLPALAAAEKCTSPLLTAEFLSPDVITEAAGSYFDIIYLPLERFDGTLAKGVVMPPVVYDSEEDAVRKRLVDAAEAGATHVMIANAGQMRLIKGLSLIAAGGYRANVNNSYSAKLMEAAGAELVTLSPELMLPAVRDISSVVKSAVVVYGRIPLMTTERCIVRAVSGNKCVCKKENTVLKDRMGAEFPVRAIDGCRSVIYNSVPVYMADKSDKLRAVNARVWHFMFTTESTAEVDGVIRAYRNEESASYPVRRLK